MKITFNTQETEQHIGKQFAGRAEAEKADRAGVSYGVYYAGNDNEWLQGMQNSSNVCEKGKTLTDLQQEAANVDLGTHRDYMTVVSHAMSEEDYMKLEEEGFKFSSMDPEEVVTILDKIKAELARSGEHIVGYTDDIDMNTLAEAVGSETLARSISDSFQEANVPLTEENIDYVKRAWDMASKLEAPGEGATHYMVDNGLEPEIWNLYLAQNSGAESMTGSKPRYYAEDVPGYFARSVTAKTGAEGDVSGTNQGVFGGEMSGELWEQAKKVITEAGLPLSDDNLKNAAWLMEQSLPLTGENLVNLQALQSVNFPVAEDTFARAAAIAIAGGKAPIYANLAQSETIYEKAARLAEKILTEDFGWDKEDISARKQLEEIRLRMTAEVNVKLLKSGFAIDTAPMEELLEALKQAEAQLAKEYFPQDAQALPKYELFRQTGQVMEELPKLPAQLLGHWSVRETVGTVTEFHREGVTLQGTLEKAQESYEALMTAPRSDLGDSIRKAFANVDDILGDLNLTVNEANQRAVRILGYNSMDITVENIEQIKTVDEQVKSVIERMTPAATLQMIRDGKNPLEMTFPELEQYFDTLSQEYEESTESYSRFLYHLEQNKDITSAEREAYIGIYRLLRQIEKSDGAVVGAVVNTGVQLQFANLLSAVRSNHFRHMDVKVTDETGLMQELVREGSSISEQIATVKDVVTQMSENEETDVLYRKQELEHLRTLSDIEPESYALLERSGQVISADNLFAAQGLLKDVTSPYKKWAEKREKFAAAKEQAEDFEAPESLSALESLIGLEEEAEFAEGYRNHLEELRDRVEAATTEEAESFMDVRDLQLIHKQLTVAVSLADSKEYMLPMYIGDELGRVHLTLVKSESSRGLVAINVDYGDNAHVEAHLQITEGKLTGYLVGNTQEEVTKLQKAADIFHELLREDASVQLEAGELPIVSRSNGNHTGMEAGQDNSSDTAELYRVARLFLQAMK